MAARAEAPHTPASLIVSRGRYSSWLTTLDHKRIGILYMVTSLIFFIAGGILALLIRAQLEVHAFSAPQRARTTAETHDGVAT